MSFLRSSVPSPSPSRRDVASRSSRRPVPRTNRSSADYRHQFGDAIEQTRGGAFLDVGAGDSEWLQAGIAGCVNVRVDLDYAAAPPLSRQGAVAAGAIQLPFRTETFDMVLCSWMIPYAPSPVLVVREMIRVARVGGMIMIHPTFHVLTRFVHPSSFVYEKCFSASLGSRPTLVIEKVVGISEAEWDVIAASIALAAKLAPGGAARAVRQRWHAMLISRVGTQMDHRAPSVAWRYLQERVRSIRT